MNQKIDSVSVKVVEEDPNGITINVRNKPDHNGCNSENVANAPVASTPPKVQKEESELINSALQVNFKKLL